MRFAHDRRWQAAGLLGAAALAALVAVFFVSRGSGSGGGDSPAAAASPVSGGAGALLGPEDLPGEGWTIVAERALSSFAEAPEAFVPASPELPECHPLRQFEATLLATDAAFESGVMRALARGSEPGALARVTQFTARLDSPESAAAVVAAAEEALAGTALADCIAAAARRNNLEVNSSLLAPLAVPAGGASQLLRFEPVRAGLAPATQGLLWWCSGRDLFAFAVATTGNALGEDDLRRAAELAIERAATP